MMNSDAPHAALDLHMHSVYSDGSETPGELIAQAREAGLVGIAITDHDCLRQLSAVRRAAREAGYPVLAGTEVSAQDPNTGRKVHILAYGLEATGDGSGPVERLVAPTLDARTKASRAQARIIEGALNDPHGSDSPLLTGPSDMRYIDESFSLETARAAAGASTGLYKQHLMEALVHLPRNDETYDRIYRALFKGDGIAVMDIPYPAATDAVRAIREQGGVPVLAHADQMDSWGAIPELVRAGLKGIEVHHPDHDATAVDRAREAALRHGLMMTGGSDYHGRYGTPARVGIRSIAMCEASEQVAELFEQEARLT